MDGRKTEREEREEPRRIGQVKQNGDRPRPIFRHKKEPVSLATWTETVASGPPLGSDNAVG